MVNGDGNCDGDGEEVEIAMAMREQIVIVMMKEMEMVLRPGVQAAMFSRTYPRKAMDASTTHRRTNIQ